MAKAPPAPTPTSNAADPSNPMSGLGYLGSPPSYEDLQAQAQGQVDQEINAQVNPLNIQIGDLQSRESTALGGIQDMFKGLMPYVSDSAQRVEAAQNQGLAMEQQIFQAAGQRMNSLAQSRAQEAQALAQQMGGPVSTGDFTSATDPYKAAMPQEAAAGMIHGLSFNMAGTQQAEAFAGQVFPAMETEQVAQARNFFETQINDTRKQIAQLEASKSGAVNTKLNDLLSQERQYSLQLQQLQLDKTKAAHDWAATQHTLKNDDARLALAGAGVTGQYQGKPTLQAQKTAADIQNAQTRNQIAQQRANAYAAHMSAQDRITARKLGLSAQQFAMKMAHSEESLQIQQQRLKLQQQKNAMAMVDAAMNPNSGKPITQSVKYYIPKGSLAELRAADGKMADAHYDPAKHQWYQYQRLTLTPQQWAAHGGYSGATPITDPQRLYDLLMGAGIPGKMARNLVRTRTGINDFTPGKPVNYTAAELKGLPFDEIRGIALARGFKPDPKHPHTSQQLIDFILARNAS